MTLTSAPTLSASASSGGGSRVFSERRRAAYQHVLQEDWEQAETALAGICTDSRFSAQDWVALATARYRLGRLTGMHEAAGQALRSDPSSLKAQHLLTLSLVLQRRWDDAVRAFEQCPSPQTRSHYQYVLNHGTALSQVGRAQEAAAVFLEAAMLKPGDPTVHMKLGLALRDMKMYGEAAESFTTAGMLDAQRVAAKLMALHMRQHACLWDGFDAWRDEALKAVDRADPDVRAEGAVFALTAVDHPPALFRRATEQVARTCARDVVPLPARRVSPGGGKLKIGYVSNDFHNHATALLLVEALEQRDRSRFDVTLYSYSKDDNSALQHRIRSACERYVDLTALNESQMARRIHADRVDLLVDLKGHTYGNRFGLFAYRPAPLQASFLGFPGTTGASYIDYFIGDRCCTPIEEADDYAEKIAQMPHSYQPNDGRRDRPAPMTRAQCGLPPQALVLGCFNQAFKLTPETFDTWMNILKQVPAALLWMLEDNPQATRNIRAEAARRGVPPERILFAPKLPLAQHLARLPLADVMLDNWPCNAHTTASDALWMGVPMITLRGRTFASRVAASLLGAVELQELVCETPQQYEQLVVSLLSDAGRLQRWRDHLERGRSRFTLFDGKRFAADLERLYERMVERARRGLPPDHLPAQG